MGFGGGNVGALANHEHDPDIPLDGGALAPTKTSFEMAQGSLLVSDGTAVNELTIGSNLDVLTSNGTTAAWSAAAGGSGSLEKIFSVALSSDQNAFTATFTAVNQSDIACIYGVLNAESTANENSDITINGIGGFGTGNTTYNTQGFYVAGGAIGYVNTTGGEKWRVINEAAGFKYQTQFWISCNAVQDQIQSTWLTTGNEGLSYVSGYNTTASQTSISSITFDFEQAAKVYKDKTRLDIYKVNV
jgi:hypothetical protein